MKDFFKREYPTILMLLLPFLLIFIFWNDLPETYPINWSISADNQLSTGKGTALFFIPLLNIFFYIMFLFLPRIVIRDEIKSIFGKSYNILRNSVCGFLLIVFMIILFIGLDIL